MIRFLFEIFQGAKTLGEDFNLEEFLKDQLKDDIKINFNQYLEIINGIEKAKKSLNECLDEKIYENQNLCFFITIIFIIINK